MKSIKYSLVAMALTAAGLTGCQNSYDAPELQTPVADMEPTVTIAEVKQIIYDAITDPEEDVIIPVGTMDDGKHYIIHGRVISSDASGNIYRNLIIQDETAAMCLSINEGSMWTSYRVGQDVVMDLTGSYIGTNGCYYQVGWLSDYNGEESMGFMSWFQFKNSSELNGMPNQDFEYVSMNGPWPADKPYCIVTTIKDIVNLNSYSVAGYKAMSQLVEIQNVRFEEGGKEIYAAYQESNEYRWIVDQQGNRMPINNSGYSTFRADTLPTGWGNIRAILSYYQFSTLNNKWQLILRDKDDVLFNLKGSQTNPYTVAEAIAQDNNGRVGWTKGYIVGSAKAGVTTVKSNDDVVFGKGETIGNVLIAADKNEKDWTKCVVVELPSGSGLRQEVNLVENPGVIGYVLTVNGSFTEYLGMHGITGNNGSDFTLRPN